MIVFSDTFSLELILKTTNSFLQLPRLEIGALSFLIQSASALFWIQERGTLVGLLELRLIGESVESRQRMCAGVVV